MQDTQGIVEIIRRMALRELSKANPKSDSVKMAIKILQKQTQQA